MAADDFEPGSGPALDIARSRARQSDELDRHAAALLERQGRIVEDQRRHLGLQHARERLRLVRDVALSGLLLAAVAGLGWMVFAASQANGLVVEPVRSPPALAGQGLDGVAVASRLLDKLQSIQAGTATARSAGTFRNNWADDIKVEIPQMGVSVGELWRDLTRALGRETYVSGELIQQGGDLELVVRSGSAPGTVLRGPPSDLEPMLQKAAETLYEQTQPYLYSAYLRSQHRDAEALIVARRLAYSGPRGERPWAYAGISDLLFRQGDLHGASGNAAMALKLDPDLVLGHANHANAELTLGHDEHAAAAIRQALRLISTGQAREVTADARTTWPVLFRGSLANLNGDFTGSAEAFARAGELPSFETLTPTTHVFEAQARALAHDVSRSRRLLSGADLTDASSLPLVADWGAVSLPRYFQAVALEDWQGALADLQASDRAASAMGPLGQALRRNFLWPHLATTYARTGQIGRAAGLAARTPLDCYVCLRARAFAAARAGQANWARAWYARAVAFAPSMPAAYEEWGRWRLESGDVQGALELFDEARRRGPRWAEPLAGAGDALASRGDWSGALVRYDAAVDRAPRWGGLRIRRAAALSRLGRTSEAMKDIRLAQSMDLTVSESAALTSPP